MQFPVPQFTDVEDKIIGPLTIKQFGIVFAAGIVVFLGFSATKSILVLVFFTLLYGLPALGLAFMPFNGRPIYNSIPKLFGFLTSPKLLIFHKEAQSLKSKTNLKDAEMTTTEQNPKPATTQESADERLKKVTELLRATSTQEKDVTTKLRE